MDRKNISPSSEASFSDDYTESSRSNNDEFQSNNSRDYGQSTSGGKSGNGDETINRCAIAFSSEAHICVIPNTARSNNTKNINDKEKDSMTSQGNSKNSHVLFSQELQEEENQVDLDNVNGVFIEDSFKSRNRDKNGTGPTARMIGSNDNCMQLSADEKNTLIPDSIITDEQERRKEATRRNQITSVEEGSKHEMNNQARYNSNGQRNNQFSKLNSKTSHVVETKSMMLCLPEHKDQAFAKVMTGASLSSPQPPPAKKMRLTSPSQDLELCNSSINTNTSNTNNSSSSQETLKGQHQKKSEHSRNSNDSGIPLALLCLNKSWDEAKLRAQTHPHEAEYGYTSSARALLSLNNTNNNDTSSSSSSSTINIQAPTTQKYNMASTPLALACRYGAPPETIKSILEASKLMVRRCIPHRGTPLHEAIMSPHYDVECSSCDNGGACTTTTETTTCNNYGVSRCAEWNCDKLNHYVGVIGMLIKADEELDDRTMTKDNAISSSSKTVDVVKCQSQRATLMQDVDGNVPLHLLIRRGFYTYLSGIGDRNFSGGNSKSLIQCRRVISTENRKFNKFDKNNDSTIVDDEIKYKHEHPLLYIIRKCIESSPEAAAIPDCREYEETPLILAIKSSVYAIQRQQHNEALRRDIDRQYTDEEESTCIRINTSNVSYQEEEGESSSVEFQVNFIDPMDDFKTQLERRIFDICKLMLRAHPAAASLVAATTGYTAVHSAVFHGRCCDTIRLLLNADSIYRQEIQRKKEEEKGTTGRNIVSDSVKIARGDIYGSSIGMMKTSDVGASFKTPNVVKEAAMRANNLGELPLHFAAMRGECTRSIALLSHSAPWAVLKRDVKLGMTPLHWLWVRFVDIMLERFGSRHFGDETTLNCETKMEDSDDEYSTNVGTENYCIKHGDSADLNNKESGDTPHSLFSLPVAPLSPSSYSSVYASSLVIQDNDDIKFDLEYHLRTSAIDPSVNFIRMRHILPAHKIGEYLLTKRIISVLKRVKERHIEMVRMTKYHESPTKQKTKITQKPRSEMRNNSRCEKTYQSYLAFSEPITSFNQDSEITNEVDDVIRCPFVFDSYPVNSKILGYDNEALQEEQVISLFWAKVTSLLLAASQLDHSTEENFRTDASTFLKPRNFMMLHTACSNPSPLAIVNLCICLYPEQLRMRDHHGKMALHHAACREWDSREVPRKGYRKKNTSNSYWLNYNKLNGVDSDNIQGNERLVPEHIDSRHYQELEYSNNDDTVNWDAPDLIYKEPFKVLKAILCASPPQAVRIYDLELRLPLHCVIDTVVRAVAFQHVSKSDNRDEKMDKIAHDEEDSNLKSNMKNSDINCLQMIDILRLMVQSFPDALERRDGKTGLYPFLQATATATQCFLRSGIDTTSTLSIPYFLLRENPSIVSSLM